MKDLIKEGREKLEGVYGDNWKANAPWMDIRGRGIGGCNLKESGYKVVDIRGWGYLSYLGNDEAVEIQKNTAQFIAWSRNNMGALLNEIDSYASTVKILEERKKEDIDRNVELRKKITKLGRAVKAAKELQDLKHHKVLNGKDDHYLNNKEKAWSNLELELHHNAKCEASCGYCAHEAELGESND